MAVSLLSYQMFMKVSLADLITYQYGVKNKIFLCKLLEARLDGTDGWVLQFASLNVIFETSSLQNTGLFFLVWRNKEVLKKQS